MPDTISYQDTSYAKADFFNMYLKSEEMSLEEFDSIVIGSDNNDNLVTYKEHKETYIKEIVETYVSVEEFSALEYFAGELHLTNFQRVVVYFKKEVTFFSHIDTQIDGKDFSIQTHEDVVAT